MITVLQVERLRVSKVEGLVQDRRTVSGRLSDSSQGSFPLASYSFWIPGFLHLSSICEAVELRGVSDLT